MPVPKISECHTVACTVTISIVLCILFQAEYAYNTHFSSQDNPKVWKYQVWRQIRQNGKVWSLTNIQTDRKLEIKDYRMWQRWGQAGSRESRRQSRASDDTQNHKGRNWGPGLAKLIDSFRCGLVTQTEAASMETEDLYWIAPPPPVIWYLAAFVGPL